MGGPPDKDVAAAFGRALRARRLDLGWSMDELAARAKSNRAYVNQLELGQRNPSLRVAARLAGALGTTLSELLEGV